MDLSKLSDSDLEALARNDMSAMSDEGLTFLSAQASPQQQAQAEFVNQIDTAGEIGMKGLELAGRTLDWPAGMARVAYKGLQNIPYSIRTGKSLTTNEDLLRALQGRAPTMAEFAKREGAPDTTATDVAGFVGDVALDPLNAVSLGVGKLLPKATKKVGETLYKSGLKRLDIEGAKYGKEPVSDLLLKEGVSGSYESIQKQMDDLAEGYLRERDVILKKADEAGGRVSMAEAMAPLQKRINEIRATKDPNLQGVAESMQNDLNQYLKLENPAYSEVSFIPGEQKFVELPVSAKATGQHRELNGLPLGQPLPQYSAKKPIPAELIHKNRPTWEVKMGQVIPESYKPQLPEIGAYYDPPKTVAGREIKETFVTPSQASGFKSSQYNKTGDAAYKEASQTPIGKSLQKTKGFGLKEATEKAVEKASGKQSAEDLADLNEKLGRILTTGEKAEQEAAKEIMKNSVTSVDALAAGMATAAGGPQAGAYTVLMKKLADVSKMTGPRTTVGKGLYQRGQTPMMLERNLLYSPWPRLEKYTDEEK